MKIRNDYVSNSSSSSFIVSIEKDRDFHKFVKDVVKSCTSDPDGCDKEFLEYVNESNKRNLEYCLNTYELLFLGTLNSGKTQTRISLEEYENIGIHYDIVVKEDGEYWGNHKIVERNPLNPDQIVIEETIQGYGIAVDKDTMEMNFRWDDKEESEIDYTNQYNQDCKERRIKNIKKICRIHGHSYPNFLPKPDLYEITKKTILNTEELINEGFMFDFEEWEKDIPALRRRLENGERLFYIRMAQSGDGMGVGHIYATSGWDSDFNKDANVEVLFSECG